MCAHLCSESKSTATTSSLFCGVSVGGSVCVCEETEKYMCVCIVEGDAAGCDGSFALVLVRTGELEPVVLWDSRGMANSTVSLETSD